MTDTPGLRRGRFITFEGGEGAGKSTQLARLGARLAESGYGILATREPGGSPGAEAIRHVLLSGAAKPLGPAAEAILFGAARADHVANAIEPALAAGKWVLCDRFIDSTRVYQGALGEVDPKLVRALERVAVAETKPDLTLVLDVPTELGVARVEIRGAGRPPDRFEGEDLAYHRRVRDAYRQLAEREPNRCILIDASRRADEVAAAIWQAVTSRLIVPDMLAQAREVLG
ncbi:dTMP kinase [Blastochloris sulfoviridis]|uniref:Thymidylate kinase n=1 Tax=Blastochloris sulfoviridis TaxID=50712 RepID=A0A5M6I1W8_9HYPH|nr:dTMP kinase [Blastochloris sulfoviridis]KAA5602152.1 dTMP kinase [Blastochloris sulfoviridis]